MICQTWVTLLYLEIPLPPTYHSSLLSECPTLLDRVGGEVASVEVGAEVGDGASHKPSLMPLLQVSLHLGQEENRLDQGVEAIVVYQGVPKHCPHPDIRTRSPCNLQSSLLVSLWTNQVITSQKLPNGRMTFTPLLSRLKSRIGILKP